MVLADTSVWIRALANREPFRNQLDQLLENDEVAGHEFVYGELLMGDRGGRREFLNAYARMGQASTIPHREVLAFVKARRLHGRGLGWIDAHLLASAVAGGLKLWSADSALSRAARELGVERRSTGEKRRNGVLPPLE